MDIIDIKDKFDSLVKSYDDLYDDLSKQIDFDNKKVLEVLKNQIPIMIEWEVMSKQFNYLYDQVELVEDKTFASALSVAMNNKHRSINISEGKETAKADPSVITVRHVKNQIRHMRDECKGILEVVHSRKYTLNNIVNALVANVENTIL